MYIIISALYCDVIYSISLFIELECGRQSLQETKLHFSITF